MWWIVGPGAWVKYTRRRKSCCLEVEMRRCGEDCCLGGMSEGMRGRSQAVNHYSHLCALLVWSSPGIYRLVAVSDLQSSLTLNHQLCLHSSLLEGAIVSPQAT